MATLTARLGLRKPGGGDNVTVLTDLDNNYDILDRAVLVAVGTERAVVTGGVDVSGSPTGYNDEVRFTSAGANVSQGLSSLGTGNAHMFFDFRAAANTGDWLWRNGTSGGTTRMSLSSTARLTLIPSVSRDGVLVESAVDEPAVTLHSLNTGGLFWALLSTGGASSVGQGRLSFFEGSNGLHALTLRSPNGLVTDQTPVSIGRQQGAAYTVQPITEGAADSGGVGFRVLRIPN